MFSIPKSENLKQGLRRSPVAYSVARGVYGWLRADLRWKRYRKVAFRKRCYAKFDSGARIVTRSYGNVAVSYEAISPKNYYHLSMGSQHEDRFMPLLFDRHVREGDIVLDIGAHTGMYSIPFAKAVGESGKVYAFEPEADGHDAIVRNASLNSVTNLVVLNQAVTDRDGTIDFFVRPDKDTHSVFEETMAPSPLGIQHTMVVETSSVDSLLERQAIPQPDFVKIDVEGAELKVLDGMEKAATGIRHVLVEIHEAVLRTMGIEDPVRAIESKLRSLGYTDLDYVDQIHVLATRRT